MMRRGAVEAGNDHYTTGDVALGCVGLGFAFVVFLFASGLVDGVVVFVLVAAADAVPLGAEPLMVEEGFAFASLAAPRTAARSFV